MTDTSTSSHGLEAFTGARYGDDANITLTIRSDLGHIILRGDGDNAAFVAAAEKALGQPLPIAPNTISKGGRDVHWLGPNEWLILAGINEVASIETALGAELAEIHSAVNVLSGGQVAMSLAGSRVRELLAKGCTIDFHPRRFTQGMCAQSGLAKASVLIALPGDDGAFTLVVRRSFSDYLLHWLSNAAGEYGIRVEESRPT